MLSTITLIFWVTSGVLVVGVCVYNAHKTRGGKISHAFMHLGVGAALMDIAAIVVAFTPDTVDAFTVQFFHDIVFVLGFVFLLLAANRFRKAMLGF